MSDPGYATGGLISSPTPAFGPGGCIVPNLSTPGWIDTFIKVKPSTTADEIALVCDEIKAMLLEKNRKYGDSALNPTRVFSKADSIEQIKVRIDDKLSRLRNAQDDEDEDVVSDLMGYLVLLRIAQNRKKNADSVISVTSGDTFAVN